jgi:peptide/nickel transport system permease protein
MAAVPGFVLAILCLVYFGVQLKWFPISGLDSFKSWILPVCTNAFPGIASTMRMTRTTMLEVIRQDYIVTARSKGLKEKAIIFKHALRNCLIPLVTVIGGSVAMVLSGSIIVENIFSIRGLGTYLYGGLVSRDYPIITGCVLLTAFMVCVINLIVDILYGFIDPRIKAQYSSSKKKAAVLNDAPESEEVA